MLIGIERFVFGHFSKMPRPVRVFTYLFLLFLFAYLLLVPRFINGQLVTAGESGGAKPYRGGTLQMHVDGRVLKFKANEDGYWSVPVVSLLPHAVRVEFLVVDAEEWYPVEFGWLSLWTHDAFRVAVLANPPGVKILGDRRAAALAVPRFAALRGVVGWLAGGLVPDALAGPSQTGRDAYRPMDSETLSRIQAEVTRTVAQVLGQPTGHVTLASPLRGEGGPTYVQRIEIIDRLERKFGFRIPDEHWMYMTRVGELVNYVQKREAYGSRAGEPGSRPVFKR